MKDLYVNLLAGFIILIWETLILALVKKSWLKWLLVVAPFPILIYLVFFQATPTIGVETPTRVFEENKPIDAQTSPVDGMILVLIPSGDFTMGSEDNKQSAPESPRQTLNLESFWIDQTEVTNRMYGMCVLANECLPPRKTAKNQEAYHFGDDAFGNYPVQFVSWYQAQNYCEWAGRRLPSEAEWEKAARDTDGRVYPWGNDPPIKEVLNFEGSLIGGSTQVHQYSFGTSPYGAFEMAGNLYEWITDDSPYTNGFKLLKGGFWNDSVESGYLRVTARRDLYPSNDEDPGAGFRCAKSDTIQPKRNLDTSARCTTPFNPPCSYELIGNEGNIYNLSLIVTGSRELANVYSGLIRNLIRNEEGYWAPIPTSVRVPIASEVIDSEYFAYYLGYSECSQPADSPCVYVIDNEMIIQGYMDTYRTIAEFFYPADDPNAVENCIRRANWRENVAADTYSEPTLDIGVTIIVPVFPPPAGNDCAD